MQKKKEGGSLVKFITEGRDLTSKDRCFCWNVISNFYPYVTHT